MGGACIHTLIINSTIPPTLPQALAKSQKLQAFLRLTSGFQAMFSEPASSSALTLLVCEDKIASVIQALKAQVYNSDTERLREGVWTCICILVIYMLLDMWYTHL